MRIQQLTCFINFFTVEFYLQQVFAISSKVHTTRCSARAVAITDDTQLVFLDTPGIVSVKESVRYVILHLYGRSCRVVFDRRALAMKITDLDL